MWIRRKDDEVIPGRHWVGMRRAIMILEGTNSQAIGTRTRHGTRSTTVDGVGPELLLDVASIGGADNAC
jgi:hypothetical protein